MTTFSVVVPTLGRPSLARLLASLEAGEGPRPDRVVLVDDRPPSPVPLDVPETGWVAERLHVQHSCARGPAAARNQGWRVTDGEWVVFVDDDVLLTRHWLTALASDLAVADDVGGSQGRISVALPRRRRPTDWERSTAGLSTARWITADMAYRRSALEAAGGFDARFPRAFREDADLALRVQECGWRLVRGTREAQHPVRPSRWRASVVAQRGNADDALMCRRHGRDWHARAGADRGRIGSHVRVVAALAGAAAARATGRRRTAALAAAAWAAATARFAWIRIAPGPRDRTEIATMITTSVLIPPAAVWHRARGWWRYRHAPAWPTPIDAVLFDRDGTLVHDVPYNGDDALVRPVDGARSALDRLRTRGVEVGLITNQSGVARGLLSVADVERVNARVAQLLGPFATVQVCPHDDDADCACRKPRPGMVLSAAAALGVRPSRCAVVGDTAADIKAGVVAGAAACVLVPNAATRVEEFAAAPLRASDLAAAVTLLLERGRR